MTAHPNIAQALANKTASTDIPRNKVGSPAQKKSRAHSAWDIRLATILFDLFQKEA
jgi:hypothetical protein